MGEVFRRDCPYFQEARNHDLSTRESLSLTSTIEAQTNGTFSSYISEKPGIVIVVNQNLSFTDLSNQGEDFWMPRWDEGHLG